MIQILSEFQITFKLPCCECIFQRAVSKIFLFVSIPEAKCEGTIR